MKVQVQITETLQKIVEVVADDADDATGIVQDWYDQQELILDADDFKDVEIEVVG